MNQTTPSMLTVCNGNINSAGICDKCFQKSQSSNAICSRLVPYEPLEKIGSIETANDFLKYKGIIKEGYSVWICRFENGLEFNIGDLMEEYHQLRAGGN